MNNKRPEELEHSPEELRYRAKELAGDASRELLDAANRRGQRNLASLGEKFHQAADYVERAVSESDEQDVSPTKRDAVERVAGAMHSAGAYLSEHDPAAIAKDMDVVIRRHPYRAIFVSLGIGWMIGRAMRRD